MQVDLVFAAASGQVQRISLELPDRATLAEALAKVGMQVPDGGAAAVHGRLRSPDDMLIDGDRIDLCQPLKADPKQARRIRARVRP